MKTEWQLLWDKENYRLGSGDILMCVKPGARLPCGQQFLLPVLVTQVFLLDTQISQYGFFGVSSAF